MCVSVTLQDQVYEINLLRSFILCLKWFRQDLFIKHFAQLLERSFRKTVPVSQSSDLYIRYTTVLNLKTGIMEKSPLVVINGLRTIKIWVALQLALLVIKNLI